MDEPELRDFALANPLNGDSSHFNLVVFRALAMIVMSTVALFILLAADPVLLEEMESEPAGGGRRTPNPDAPTDPSLALGGARPSET